MSLTKDHGDFVFECEKCHTTLETRTSNFDAALNVLHRYRWKAFAARGRQHVKTEWQHRCPDCQHPSLFAHGKTRSETRVRSLGFPSNQTGKVGQLQGETGRGALSTQQE